MKCSTCTVRACDPAGLVRAPLPHWIDEDPAGDFRSRGPIRTRSLWAIPGHGGGRPKELKTCPLPMLPWWIGRLWRLFDGWSRGALPRAGGIDDQPAWYLPAMRALEADVGEFRTLRFKREDRFADQLGELNKMQAAIRSKGSR